jgi:membrane protease subunit HflK
MERIFNGTDKIILDSGNGGSGVVPYLPLNELRRPQQQTQQQGQTQGQTGGTR